MLVASSAEISMGDLPGATVQGGLDAFRFIFQGCPKLCSDVL